MRPVDFVTRPTLVMHGRPRWYFDLEARWSELPDGVVHAHVAGRVRGHADADGWIRFLPRRNPAGIHGYQYLELEIGVEDYVLSARQRGALAQVGGIRIAGSLQSPEKSQNVQVSVDFREVLRVWAQFAVGPTPPH